ncbi:MAG: hypothetical protein WCP34_11185 [Pseudomonadota bacterium]
MRRKTEPTLIPQAHLKLRPMTLRIPSDILDRVQQVKEDAAALGYVFEVQTVVVEAILQALGKAERELERMLEKSN